jgi:pimeloyl-ACP methyl ester carboxylesterase
LIVARVLPSRRLRGHGTRVLIATIFLLVPLLAGCGHGGAPVPARTSTPTGESVAPELEAFYHQVLHWSDCGDDTECASASVPLDWADPAKESLSIALARHSATGDDRLGSLLVNPGGPGGSGVDFVTDSLSTMVDKKLESRFDIVGFDPRGVGKSSPVRCYEPEQMDDYLYGFRAGLHGSDERLRDEHRNAAAFAAACVDRSGDLLPYINTVNTAKDLDLLRAVLGETQLNYLGFSYGTLLGATYAGLYPAKVGRMALDGALDPASSGHDLVLGQAEGFERALRSFLADCLATSGCPFSGSVDDGIREVRALFDSVEEHPLDNKDGRTLGGNSLFIGIVAALYSEASWGRLREMFDDVIDDNPEMALKFADLYFGRTPKGQYTTNTTEAFVTVNCSDYYFDTDDPARETFLAQLRETAPIFGSYVDINTVQCANWPVKPSVAPAAIRAEGAAPILVLGTTNDPATPYRWAQNLAGQLASGHLVTREGHGHLAYNRSNSCVDEALDGYLLFGAVPASDPRC